MLTEEEVRHVAMLARMTLPDDEIARLQPQLSEILAYAEKVGEVAAADVPPTSHAYPLRNVFRDDDEVADPLPQEAVLRNAPEAEDGRFRVPAILSEEA